MSNDSVLSRVIEVVSKTFAVDGSRLSGESVAMDVDGWDSVSHAMLILDLEEAFGIEIDIESTMAARDLNELSDKISACLAK